MSRLRFFFGGLLIRYCLSLGWGVCVMVGRGTVFVLRFVFIFGFYCDLNLVIFWRI